jgi:hypothetical protein
MASGDLLAAALLNAGQQAPDEKNGSSKKVA